MRPTILLRCKVFGPYLCQERCHDGDQFRMGLNVHTTFHTLGPTVDVKVMKFHLHRHRMGKYLFANHILGQPTGDIIQCAIECRPTIMGLKCAFPADALLMIWFVVRRVVASMVIVFQVVVIVVVVAAAAVSHAPDGRL